jgi:hypothetical protein
MVELRVALEAVRNGATRWDTVAAIRAWLDAGAPPPAQHPPAGPAAPAAPAAADAADAEAAAGAARGEAGERVFAREFSWDAAKRGAAADQALAEADEAHQGGEGGRELRVMERVAAKLRHELEHTYAWFRLVRAAPDAAAAACSQVTGRGALGLAVHCPWGAEGNWGGAWWWVGGAGGSGALRRADAAEPRGGAEPTEGARATRAALRWIQRSVAPA